MIRISPPPAAIDRDDRFTHSISHPRGFTLIELIGACVLLAILLSTAVPMFAIVARERRTTEQRQFALQHAVNLLEQTRQLGWSELDPGELSVPDVDAHLKAILPGVEQSLIVQAIEDESESRQIVATVRWKDRGDQFVTPIRMSYWVSHSKETPR
ncbi:pilus assembly FimT family protein [Schlesneria paludicola]|uniref:pilus assembly FimT family protein n=1 Tax=Schlesneria paludicola TaxID=360056 RepID=UPI0002E50EE8|nr:type II secretion system protein [Schlesneria paludicola]